MEKSEKEIDSLVKTVKMCCKDIGMEFRVLRYHQQLQILDALQARFTEWHRQQSYGGLGFGCNFKTNCFPLEFHVYAYIHTRYNLTEPHNVFHLVASTEHPW